MQQLFPQNNQTNPSLRFKTNNGENYPDWESKPLSELANLLRGVSYNSHNVTNKGLLVLRSNNIQNNTINLDDLQFINKNCNDNLLLQNKDIIICMANGSKHLVGKIAEYTNSINDNNVTVGAFCGIIRVYNFSLLSNNILKYFFELAYYKDYIDSILSGSSINNLKQQDILNFSIPIPHIEEQNKIGKFLKSVDDKIEITNQKLQHLKTYKRALMQQLFPSTH
jgi:type I restriction enzyme S subunit